MQVEHYAEAKNMVNLGYHMTCRGIACRAALGPDMTLPRRHTLRRVVMKLGKRRYNDTVEAVMWQTHRSWVGSDCIEGMLHSSELAYLATM